MNNGFFHFHEVTVFLARKANRAEINEIIKNISGATKRSFPEIPMHVKVNIRYVDSDFKFSPAKSGPAGESVPNNVHNGDRDRNRKMPQGFDRKPVPVQI
jgi:hypothetical protein